MGQLVLLLLLGHQVGVQKLLLLLLLYQPLFFLVAKMGLFTIVSFYLSAFSHSCTLPDALFHATVHRRCLWLLFQRLAMLLPLFPLQIAFVRQVLNKVNAIVALPLKKITP